MAPDGVTLEDTVEEFDDVRRLPAKGALEIRHADLTIRDLSQNSAHRQREGLGQLFEGNVQTVRRALHRTPASDEDRVYRSSAAGWIMIFLAVSPRERRGCAQARTGTSWMT